MNIIGKWKIIKILIMTKDFDRLMCPIDEIKNNVSEDMLSDYLDMASTELEFLPDGTMNTIRCLTDEQAKQALAEGVELVDGNKFVESTEWKEENGEYFYYSGNQGEIMGEAVSPYEKLTFDKNGCLKFGSGFMLLEKIS